ncbi:MAG: glycosyltransferase family 39 protein, partial [Myxococcales bacterium]|nr:glycosyltransferase family 39 protein [Myxococcales bacterium]
MRDSARKAASLPDAPPWWPTFARAHSLAAALVLGVVLVLIAATFADYGMTWDEEPHRAYGDVILDWFTSGFEDDAAVQFRGDYLYGGGFDALGAIARRLSPLGPYETLHLFGALVGWLGLVGTWRFGQELGGPVAGFWSVALLAATPVYYGHMFANPKDLPFAVGHVWALYYVVAVLRRAPAVSTGLWIKLGLALGAAMCVRIGGLLTVCYLLLGIGVVAASWVLRARALTPVLDPITRLIPRLVGAIALAWAVMLIFWPWAQQDPLRRPFINLTRMSAFVMHERRMPFGDGSILTSDVPWDYLPRYFLFKLPELVLLLCAAAVLALVIAAARRRDPIGLPRAPLLLVLFTIGFPPAYAIAKGSPLYDGLRHFLFLVPSIAVVAGVTLAAGVTALARRGGRARVALAAALTAVGLTGLFDQVRTMVALHPYQYVSFNRVVGGLPGAFLRYDTDYYAATYAEAVVRLREHLWFHERARYLEGPAWVVGLCGNKAMELEYYPPTFVQRVKSSPSLAELDFFFGYTRGNCHTQQSRGPVLFKIERLGTMLAVVRDLRGERRVAASAPVDEEEDDDDDEDEGDDDDDDDDDDDE